MAPARRTAAPEPAAANPAPGPRVLKKYPNRRLYDTHTSSYITLADVKAMVLAGTEFEVRDAKTGDDLTRSILLQIILEEGAYLEKNLQSFTEFQSRLMEQTRGLSDPKAYTPEMWTQFLSGQAPVMQNLMSSYLEQSRGLFEKMQEQMKLSGTLFPGFPPGRK
jgi:polyhydroxyalkanoate synthesis regulator protein